MASSLHSPLHLVALQRRSSGWRTVLYQGVEKAACGRWQAFYCHPGRTKSVLGTFRTDVEAAEAHDMAVLANQDRLLPQQSDNQFNTRSLTACFLKC